MDPYSKEHLLSFYNFHLKQFGDRPEAGLDLAAQFEAVRRRIWPMLAVFVVVLGVASAVALLWPPTYRSMGTILIEQQEVPLLRILTDRGTEYCGSLQNHEYQLYLAIENIEASSEYPE